jgi:membrane protein DedA with SNARE-associated domain
MEVLGAQYAELGGAGILLALFIATFVSEDLACLTAGSLAAAGRIDLASAMGACFAGIFVGDLLLYGAGRVFGARALSSRLGARFVTKESLDRGTVWLRDRGASAVFVSRFVSGLRLPTYFAAGALRMEPKRFAVYLAFAAAVWTPLIIGAAALWQLALPGGAILGIVTAFVLFRYAFRLTDRKRRRLAWGRVQRVVRWEFWPIWIFYLPVIVYALVLTVRYRGLMFTAANPAIPAGGFVGESKDEIYKLIGGSGITRQFTLRHTKIASELTQDARHRAALRFIDENSLSFPIVVKPDSGERGDGVSIVRDDAQLRIAVAEHEVDVLVQEFVDGVEASVFYCRMPGEPLGRIFSVTEKIFPSVIGDGASTLEELILRDDRAYIVARKYFERNAALLLTVPAAGERVGLVDIGSHSKGAIFRDGSHLRTPDLISEIDAVCRSIPGFFFGRFDLRAASFDDLKLGRNFRIIELNGVTSESTNIYDPKYSLIDAYRILFDQWRLAFRIGAAGARLGARVSTVREIVSLVLSTKAPRFASGNVHPLHRVP